MSVAAGAINRVRHHGLSRTFHEVQIEEIDHGY